MVCGGRVELDAADYLLKPVPFERFMLAVKKAYEYISYRKTRSLLKKDDFLFIKTSHKIQKIFYSDILYLEGLKDYPGYILLIARSRS